VLSGFCLGFCGFFGRLQNGEMKYGKILCGKFRENCCKKCLGKFARKTSRKVTVKQYPENLRKVTAKMFGKIS
jgi:hypothetical protein